MRSELELSAASPRPSPETISLSRWVNERPPALGQILTAHDVARLIRRPKWALSALVLMGRLPSRLRVHGRPVGWHRTDVEQWLRRRLPSRAARKRAPNHRRPIGCCQRQRRSHGIEQTLSTTARLRSGDTIELAFETRSNELSK